MFNLKEQKYIPLLGLNAQIYNESEFNCKHVHLDADSDEKVFMVAFRTIPEDSTGVAHILEHTALCGSKMRTFNRLRAKQRTALNQSAVYLQMTTPFLGYAFHSQTYHGASRGLSQ